MEKGQPTFTSRPGKYWHEFLIAVHLGAFKIITRAPKKTVAPFRSGSDLKSQFELSDLKSQFFGRKSR